MYAFVLMLLLASVAFADDPNADERGYPPLSDLDRFPDKITAVVQKDRHNRHLLFLEGLRERWAYRPAYIDLGDLEKAIQETRKRLKAWEILHYAARVRDERRAFDDSEFERRDYLNHLRSYLLISDYMLGVMPSRLPEMVYD